MALGRAERELSRAERFRSDNFIPPIGPLPPEWARASNDGSVEFELAAAMASIYSTEIGPVRTNLAPDPFPQLPLGLSFAGQGTPRHRLASHTDPLGWCGGDKEAHPPEPLSLKHV